MAKWKTLVGAGATLAAASTVSLAAAASLDLSSPTVPSQMAAEKCSTEEAVVTFEDGEARLDIPEGCRGEELNLYVNTGSGTSSVPIPPSSVQVQAPDGNPKGALVTAGTWPLGTEWSAESLPQLPEGVFSCALIPDGECEVDLYFEDDWNQGTDQWTYQLKARITSDTTERRPWKITMNLSDPALPFLAEEVRDTNGGLVVESTSGCEAHPRTITLSGTTTWGSYHEVWKGGPAREVQIWGIETGNGTSSQTLWYCP